MGCPKLICPIHNECFNSKKDLVIHLSRSQIKECPLCDKSVGSLGELIKHLRMKNDKAHEKLYLELNEIFGDHGHFKNRKSKLIYHNSD